MQSNAHPVHGVQWINGIRALLYSWLRMLFFGESIVLTNPIPPIGFLTVRQILGDKKSNTPPIIPVCATTWWNGVKSGRYPKGIKVSANRTAWRAEDIRLLVSSLSNANQ